MKCPYPGCPEGTVGYRHNAQVPPQVGHVAFCVRGHEYVELRPVLLTTYLQRLPTVEVEHD